MQQRCNEFKLHAFSKREIAHGLKKERSHAKKIDEFVANSIEMAGVNPIYFAVQFETFRCGKIPPELVALTHDQ